MPTQRLAFLILAHQDPAQLERLCRRLAGHAIFVHIDDRAAGFPVDAITAIPGVVVVPRVPVFWGDFSVVEATLSLLRTALAQGRFDRYVLLSGACSPLRPLPELEQAFTEAPLREWISLTPIAAGSHLQTMIGRRWRMAPLLTNPALDRKLRAVWNKITKTLPRDISSETGMTPYFGNQFWALTNACVQHVLSYMAAHPEYVRAYRTVYAPDEHFFHTLVGNSDFKALAHTVPDRGSATNLQAPLHTVATNSSRTFTDADDLSAVRATGSFFIRKVSSKDSRLLLDRIESLSAEGAMSR